MSSETPRQSIAVGCQIYAGGFTLGVRRAGFDILAVMEDGTYGVDTARKNHPDIPIFTDPDQWPIDEFENLDHRIDLVYGNPPCAAWSVANAPMTTEAAIRKAAAEDPRINCTRRHFSLLEALRPRAWVWESVVGATNKGRAFTEGLTHRANELGYNVYWVLHDAQWMGVPQSRKRFFFVAIESKLVIDPDSMSPDVVTVGEALSDPAVVELVKQAGGGDRHCYARRRDLNEVISETRPGEPLIKAWERLNPDPEKWQRRPNGFVIGRPAFTITRAPVDRPSGVVMNDMVHPTEDRWMTVHEYATLCGFPHDYDWSLADSHDASIVARGVCPPVGEWIAGQIMRSLELDQREELPVFEILDVRKPFKDKPKEKTMPKKTAAAKAEKKPVGRTVAQVPDDAPAPNPDEGSGAYIQRLLLEERWSSPEIVAAVHAHFKGRRTTTSDVGYNANKLREQGHQFERVVRRDLVAPKPWEDDDTPVKEKTPKQKRAVRKGVDPNREFDTTSLTGTSHGYRVHRDYAAHFFRWGFAARFVGNETRVLDVGCGSDYPLLKVLSDRMHSVPKEYVGVDLNKLAKPPHRKWATFHGGFDFTTRYAELGTFDLVINLEVIEHMTVEHGRALLRAMRECVAPETGRLILSTPVFNGRAAANHIHEYEIDELAREIDAAGFDVETRFGTFANQRDIKKVATATEIELLDRLNRYYSNDVTACFLAPLYPDAARNNLWVLKRRD